MEKFTLITVALTLGCGCSSLTYVSSDDMASGEISQGADDMSATTSIETKVPSDGQSLDCIQSLASAGDNHDISIMAPNTISKLKSSCESAYAFNFVGQSCLSKLNNIQLDLNYRAISYFASGADAGSEHGTYSDEMEVRVRIKDKGVYMLGTIYGFDTMNSSEEKHSIFSFPWPKNIDGCIDKLYINFVSYYERSANFMFFPSLFSNPSVLKINGIRVTW